MLADGELNPPEWNIMGRQANSYKYTKPLLVSFSVANLIIRSQYGYIPSNVLEVSNAGRQTREGSRTLEVWFPISLSHTCGHI